MDGTRNSEQPFSTESAAERIAAVRVARGRWFWARLAVLLGKMAAAVRAWSRRRQLLGLDDRQLSDAGIDRSAAGRGKAAAARPDASFQGSR